MTGMNEPEPAPELVRRQSWPAAGPAELELSVDVGRVRVELSDTDEVQVEVRHEPTAATGWAQGLSGLFGWLGTATAGPDGLLGGPPDPAEAVRATEISWSETARRLVVRSPAELPLRMVPLVVTVAAPARSRIAVRTGSGDVAVTGRAGWTAVRTGSGDIRLAEVDGEVEVTTGSGEVDLGPVTGRARIRTGSGRISVAALGGRSEVKTGSGDVRLGAVSADVGVRTGSGEVAVGDAAAGSLDLTTGSGDLRIGVRPGVAAELDLSSGSGRACSDLDVAGVAPEQVPVLHVRGRTGTGDVLVTRASVPV